MQLIKGMDILLHTENGVETAQDCLVGEPAAAQLPFSGRMIPAYTIAIPKGDTHIWTDQIVELFGQPFRTVGIVEQGIEENVPTRWHKKIHVEQWIANGSCTIYEQDTYQKHIFTSVYISDKRTGAALKGGMQKRGEICIRIYSVSGGDGYVPRSGDILVIGISPHEFDTTSQQTISESMTALRQANPDYAVIQQVDAALCGMLPDYDLTGR